MKQLLASTAILAFCAGAASAEIALSGSARMGIVSDFGDTDAQFSSRVRIVFTASGETDTGLAFGASVRHDQDDAPGDGYLNGDNTVFISGAFGKLTMGDVDGAAAAAVGQVDGVGYTGLSDHNEITYIATGGVNFNGPLPPFPSVDYSTDTSVLYEYSTGPVSIYASSTQLDYVAPLGGGFDAQAYSVAGAYTIDTYKFSLGYEKLDFDAVGGGPLFIDAKNWVVGADAGFGAVTVKARYSQADLNDSNVLAYELDQWALSGTYTADALSLTAYASSKDGSLDGTGNVYSVDALGLGASYDLGGGAAVSGGVVRLDETIGAAASVEDTAYDLGLTFSF
ncbi:porin [Rhodobacter sp. SY28-1]|uniref:porin n=1 Tax=Rhodobacter sp. SY28-1 TaxID=2562317 RepID=UPI001484F7E3|nr:porin [Rhodobacter sp. SY28-1]